MGARLNAGSDDRNAARVGQRQHIRAQGTSQACSEGGKVAALQDRERCTSIQVVQDQDALDCRIPSGEFRMNLRGIGRDSWNQTRSEQHA